MRKYLSVLFAYLNANVTLLTISRSTYIFYPEEILEFSSVIFNWSSIEMDTFKGEGHAIAIMYNDNILLFQFLLMFR
jgi:hypothetical protein